MRVQLPKLAGLPVVVREKKCVAESPFHGISGGIGEIFFPKFLACVQVYSVEVIADVV